MDRVRSLQNIPTRLLGTNFFTTLARFVPSFVDEDIPPNDTPKSTTQQGPMTRARARELNLVNSFLAVHKPSSMNGVVLNSCDAFLILRNLGHEPDWRESKPDKKASVDDQIGPYQFGPPGRGNFGRP